MKLAAAQIASFLQKPDPAVNVVLFYGPDAGLVRERADNLAKLIVDDLNDPFRVAALTGAMLTDDPARLLDEMSAQALGGGRRLIRLQQAADNTTLALANFLANAPQGDSFLLIEAGDLEKRSKLRSLCESDNKTVCAIPCYVEEGAAKQRIISEILQAENLHVSRDVLVFLSSILPPDRIAMRSELEKLALYVDGSKQRDQNKSVTMEDVLAIVQDAGAAEIDDLVFAVGSGDTRRAELLLDRLAAEQTSAVAILRAAQRHFMRLQWARYQIDQGTSAGEAIKKLQPPVFWKYAESMTGQLRRWQSPQIESVLHKLYEAEAAVKRTGTPDTALCAQLLLRTAATTAA